MKALASLLLFGASLASASGLGLQNILQSVEQDDPFVDPINGLHKRATPPGDMPVIDLGYVKQKATEYGTAGNVSYYIFRNVRFAAPPVGELRFRKPQPPAKVEEVQDGYYNGSLSCAQPAGLAGSTGGTEDCLFLDVWMPATASPEKPLPVLTKWFGGGYVYGAKEKAGNPVALWKNGHDPFVFVAPNYRLGVFGWLSVPNTGVDANAGLHDGLAAMDWIRENIGKFGGDIKRSTAMGISAGAGIVMHAMVSNRTPHVPFQQVLLQSPGWQPETTPAGRVPIYETLLANAGCKDTACLRNTSTKALQTANLLTILLWNQDALGPTSGFYPVPDGDILLDHPANLFTEGKVHPTVKRAVASSARWEASGAFAVPEEADDELFIKDVGVSFTSNTTLIKIISEAYPSDGTPQSGYNRGRDLTGDMGFNCNGLWVARYFSTLNNKSKKKSGSGKSKKCCCKSKGKKSSAWRYEFNVGTAAHGADSTYTWFANDGTSKVDRPDLVKYQQDWVAEFVQTQKVSWPVWVEGSDAKALWLNDTGLGVERDYFAWKTYTERCDVLRTKVIGKGGDKA
ncbi:alpha/beta-hydrolase [Ascodesmis nigricans]|uniref:Alpha/beta-hydrolase n=1 Tax=Ascodesmis nigricans TaxID=341454 RepID=A0A4S2MSE5_9PEZI|nr:alpha/beta-hydrolase [Ascodesmis nigricans]